MKEKLADRWRRLRRLSGVEWLCLVVLTLMLPVLGAPLVGIAVFAGGSLAAFSIGIGFLLFLFCVIVWGP